jgi:hypothetical protein
MGSKYVTKNNVQVEDIVDYINDNLNSMTFLSWTVEPIYHDEKLITFVFVIKEEKKEKEKEDSDKDGLR